LIRPTRSLDPLPASDFDCQWQLMNNLRWKSADSGFESLAAHQHPGHSDGLGFHVADGPLTDHIGGCPRLNETPEVATVAPWPSPPSKSVHRSDVYLLVTVRHITWLRIVAIFSARRAATAAARLPPDLVGPVDLEWSRPLMRSRPRMRCRAAHVTNRSGTDSFTELVKSGAGRPVRSCPLPTQPSGILHPSSSLTVANDLLSAWQVGVCRRWSPSRLGRSWSVGCRRQRSRPTSRGRTAAAAGTASPASPARPD
jgi:hypothetical protein